jgi:putative endonuclease
VVAAARVLLQGAAVKRSYFVYIMSNSSKMLYTGVTNDVDARAFQHKSKLIPGFTRGYNLDKLVYFEVFGEIREAIRREKQIKGWLRCKKVALVESMNPSWRDLAEEHFKSAARFEVRTAKVDVAKPGLSRPNTTNPGKNLTTCHPEARFWQKDLNA